MTSAMPARRCAGAAITSAALLSMAAAILLVVAWRILAESTPAIRVAGSWVVDAPTEIAAANGWFEAGRAGPDIRLEKYGSGVEALGALIEGAAEFALAAPTPVAVALLEQQRAPQDAVDPLVVLASLGLSNRSHYLLARRDLGVHAPGDLAGRRIAFVHGSSAHYAWSVFAKFNTIDERGMVVSDLPITALETALLAGEVDAVAVWDPWGLALERALGHRAQTFPLNHLHSANWLLVSRLGVVARQPESAERVLAGYAAAIALMRSDPALAQRLHAAGTGYSESDLVEMDGGVIWTMALDWGVLANLEMQLQWLAGPALAGPLPLPTDYLYAAPLRAVAPERIHLPDYLLRDCVTVAERCP